MNACPHEPVTLRPDELEIPHLLCYHSARDSNDFKILLYFFPLRKIWQKFIRNFLLYADDIINARRLDWKKKWIKRGENWCPAGEVAV